MENNQNVQKPEFSKLVRHGRDIPTYDITGPEFDSMSFLNLTSGILLNASFTFLGAFLGNLPSVLGDNPQTVSWVIFWVSLITWVITGSIAAVFIVKEKRMKKQITGKS
jgi:VIT1/CCC1 family predicted Fe2+/Mn2+ transporter